MGILEELQREKNKQTGGASIKPVPISTRSIQPGTVVSGSKMLPQQSASQAEKAQETRRSLRQKADTSAAVETLAQRVKNTATGGSKQVASGYTGAAAMLERMWGGMAHAANSVLPENLKRAEYEAGTQELAQKYGETANRISQSAQRDISAAKDGLNGVGQLLVDVGASGVGMLSDAALGGAGGISNLVGMGVRTFGNASQEAYNEGLSTGRQLAAGSLNAAKEVASELMFDGLAGIYGGGAADDIVEDVISRFTKNEAAQTALRVAASAMGESLEEIVSDILDPILKTIYNGKSWGENWDEFSVRQMLYDGLVGGVTALVTNAGSGAVNAVRSIGTQAQQNAAAPPPVAAQAVETSNLTPAATAQNAPQTQEPLVRAMVGQAVIPTQADTVSNSDTSAAINENGLAALTPREIENLSSGQKNKVVTTFNEAVAFIRNALTNKQSTDRAYMGKVTEATAAKVLAETGVNINGYNAILSGDAVRHMFKNHGDPLVEAARGQVSLSPETAANLASVLSAPDKVYLSDRLDALARPTLIFEKQIGDYYVTAQAVSDGTHSLQTDTLYARKRKNSQDTVYYNADNDADPAHHVQNVPSQSSSSIDPTITQESKVVKDGDVSNLDTRAYGKAGVNDSLGSARGGFDPYTAAEIKYGMQEGGTNAVRPDDAPVSTNGIDRVSRSVVSAKGAAVTPDSFVPLIENSTMNGEFTYIPITNNETTQAATDYITQHGWEESLNMWRADALRGKYSPTMNVVGQLLYNNAVNSGDSARALEIFGVYQSTLRNSAQILQTAKILKNLTPETRLYMIQKSIEQFMADANVPSNITLSDEVQQAYLDARTEDARDVAVEQMQREVANQLSSTLLDKWMALRYTNMLGNFKTQIRNIAGNTITRELYRAKNAVKATLEEIAYLASGGKYERQTALFPGSNRIKAAKADFANVERIALGEGKYSLTEGGNAGDFMRGAQDMKTVFKFGDNALTRALGIEGKKGGVIYRTLEAYRNATNWAMEKGDVIFSKGNYANALAGYLKAHGVTAEQFTSEGWRQNNADFVDTARAYAIQQAQEATFRDTNAISKWASSALRGKNTPAAIRVLGEGLMPFRKTPANVAVRMEEFSPLGIINTAYKAAQAANPNSTVTGADVIDQLAKTLTGSGIFALGMWLRAAGHLRGGDDEDLRQEYFDDLNGHQNWALEFRDKAGKLISYTLDWASPVVGSLFMGAEMYDVMKEGHLDFADIEGALSQIADPMIEMSMLSGIRDTLDDIRYSDDSFGQMLGSLFVSYATQGLTNTLLGQLERTYETERMSTYVEHGTPVPAWLQRQIGKASAKIPGWDYHQYAYIDPWGRTESTGDALQRAVINFASPGYLSKVEIGRVEVELQRLADKFDQTSIFPDIAEKSFRVNGETKHLTMDEYQKYAMQKGRESARIIGAITASKEYTALNDDQKLDAIQKAYEYATAKAKGSVSGYKPSDSSWINNADKSGMSITDYLLAYEKYGGSKYLVGDEAKKVKAAQNIGMSMDEYIKMRENIDLDGNGSVSQDEARQYLDMQTILTDDQKHDLWSIINKSWKTNPY